MHIRKQNVFVAMLLGAASATVIAGSALAGGDAAPAAGPAAAQVAPANPGMTTPAAPMGGAILGQNQAAPAPNNPNIEQKPGDPAGGATAGNVVVPTGNPNAESIAARLAEPVTGRIQFLDPDGKNLVLDNGTTYALANNLDVKNLKVGQSVTLTFEMTADHPTIVKIAPVTN